MPSILKYSVEGSLLLLLVTFIAIVLAAILLFWISGWFGRRAWWRWASLLLIPLVLFWDVIPGSLYFDDLCQRVGGERISRVVLEVPGFVLVDGYPGGCGAPCTVALGKYGYSFVEKEVTEADFDHFAPAAGLYRFYLAQDDSPACGPYKKARARFLPEFRQLREIPRGYCVAALKITEFSSPYSYRWNEKRLISSTFGLLEWVDSIYERQSGVVIGQATDVLYYHSWLNRLLTPGPADYVQCPERNARLDVLMHVLIPAAASNGSLER